MNSLQESKMADRLPEIADVSGTEPFFRIKIISETVNYGRREYLLTCIMDVRVFGDNDWTYQFLDFQLLAPKNHKRTWFGRVLERHVMGARYPLHDDDLVMKPLVPRIRASVTKKFVDELAEAIEESENEKGETAEV